MISMVVEMGSNPSQYYRESTIRVVRKKRSRQRDRSSQRNNPPELTTLEALDPQDMTDRGHDTRSESSRDQVNDAGLRPPDRLRQLINLRKTAR